MKLNRIFPILLACGGMMLASTSCEDMLDTDSDSYVFDKDHNLASANDSLYSALGILTQMQALGERYVTLGELRGDLVTVPPTAAADLQHINAFEAAGEGSAMLSRRDYYSVINNCNVALTRMNTAVTEHGVQVMLPEYAAIMTMRSWTLLQAALTYGSVSYLTEPLLDVDAVERQFAAMPLDNLVTRLIADLEPYAGVETPDYGSIDGLASRSFFIRPALLLGDLYLYNGDYRQAAAMYYRIMKEGNYTLSYENGNRWTTSVRAESTVSHNLTYTRENVVMIPYASDAKKYHPNLVNMTFSTSPSMLPAEWFVNEMATAQHFHIDRLGITNISGFLEGDLRGSLTDREGKETASAFGPAAEPGTANSRCLIMKYLTNGTSYSSVSNPGNPMFAGNAPAVITDFVSLYRIPHLMLRYAEAVNRAGKPTLAFAALKYGLRGEVLADEEKVDPEEIEEGTEWLNFGDTQFDSNYGSAMRGRGLGIAVEQTSYVIPEELTEKADVIDWVEERILEEMAAETCFEGNRFFDLLRVSRHRPNHPAFLAGKVGRRFANPAAMEARLSDLNNLWVR